MLGKRLRFTGVVVALCLAMSAAPAQATSLLPEVDDEVLAHEPRTKPHADGIIAILIGAVAPKDK